MPPVTPSSTFFGGAAGPLDDGPELRGVFIGARSVAPRAYRRSWPVFHRTNRSGIDRSARYVSGDRADIRRLSAAPGRGRIPFRDDDERRTAGAAARPMAGRGAPAREAAEGRPEGAVRSRAHRGRARLRRPGHGRGLA